MPVPLKQFAVSLVFATVGFCMAANEVRAAPSDVPSRRDYVGVIEVTHGDASRPTTMTSADDETVDVDASVDTGGGGLFEESLAGASEDGKGSLGQAAARHGVGVDIGGYVRGDVFVGKLPSYKSGEIKAGYGELSLQARVAKERLGDAYGEVRLRYGQQGEVRDLFIELREAYVNAYLGPVDIRLGHQIIVWGRADAFNPTNNLNSFDLRIRSPLEDDRRMANLAARISLNLRPVRIEGVWLPLYRAIEYPPFETGEYITLSDPDFPKPFLRNGTYAGRVHLELPAFETSASYVFGWAPLPGIGLRDYTVGVDPTEVRIQRRAYNQHVVGWDFSTAIGDIIGIRGEAAYRLPLDYQSRVHAARPDLQYVLGLDRSFGPVNLIGQYMGRFVFDWQREDGPEVPVSPEELSGWMEPLPPLTRERVEAAFNDEFAKHNQMLFSQLRRVQHLASLRVEWLTLHDTLSLSALGMVNFTTKEWLLYPKIGYRISDHLSTFVGAEIYVGPEGTLLGLIDEVLSAGYAELRFSF